MAHKRALIRAAVTSLLMSNTGAGVNVFPNRVYDVAADQLPCILVLARDESVVYVSQSQLREQQRTLQLDIAIQAQSSADIDDVLDVLAAQVELVMDASALLNGLISNYELKDTVLEVGQNGAKMLGKAVLSYLITYYTSEGV